MLDLHVFLTTVSKGNMNIVHNSSFVFSKLLHKYIIMLQYTKRYYSNGHIIQKNEQIHTVMHVLIANHSKLIVTYVPENYR